MFDVEFEIFAEGFIPVFWLTLVGLPALWLLAVTF